MGAVSLILGITSFVFMVAGMFTSMVPFVGSILSFGAPVLALFGLVLGGISMSRANRMGEGSGMATAGMIVSGICFVISLVFALTCGMCNACVSTAAMQPNHPGAYGNTPTPGSFGYTPPGSNVPSPNVQFAPTPPVPAFPGNPNTDPSNTDPSNTDPSTDPSNPDPDPDVAVAICDDAFACCLEFADGDEDFCTETLRPARLSTMAGDTCQRMKAGWAQGLRAMGDRVPPACI